MTELAETVTIPISNSWLSSMGWFRTLAGGITTAVIVLAVVVFAACMLGIVAAKIFNIRTRASLGVLVWVLIGSCAAASLSGLVKWGANLIPPPTVTVHDSSLGPPPEAMPAVVAGDATISFPRIDTVSA